ncbi:MAG: hypothetical protein IPI49_01290 [Myxococcales bacterium]|nr:hypothetical protein [Myxococcales bacterium]
MDDLSLWCTSALATIDRALNFDSFWAARCHQLRGRAPKTGVHLAVLVEPFLGYVLDGSKTIESRFAIRRLAPYGHVHAGDVVLLKAASGPVAGICAVEETWFFQLNCERVASIRKEFGKAMRADTPAFWEQRKAAAFASLMRVGKVRALPKPMACPKRDRRGWVVLRPGSQEHSLESVAA